MKNIDKIFVLGIAIFVLYVAFHILAHLPDDKPTFEVLRPKTAKEMKIPPQYCEQFLDVNPHACDKG